MKKILILLLSYLIAICCFADDPTVQSFVGGFFQASRSPSVTENYVNSALSPTPDDYKGKLYWYDTNSQSIYWFGGGTNDAFVWIPLSSPASQANIVDGATDAATNATTNLPTNYNALTSLLDLANAMNTANAAQNDLATKYNALATKYNDLATKVNTLFTHLEAQGLQAAS